MNGGRNVAILIFDEVEVLDFCGPFEVFSVTARQKQPAPFNVYLVAEKRGVVLARNQFSVNPRYDFADCPPPDILVVPGGWGTRREMGNPKVIDWIKAVAAKAELVLSVCTGALLLARAGLLDGLKATTHHDALGLLREIAPKTAVLDDQREYRRASTRHFTSSRSCWETRRLWKRRGTSNMTGAMNLD